MRHSNNNLNYVKIGDENHETHNEVKMTGEIKQDEIKQNMEDQYNEFTDKDFEDTHVKTKEIVNEPQAELNNEDYQGFEDQDEKKIVNDNHEDNLLEREIKDGEKVDLHEKIDHNSMLENEFKKSEDVQEEENYKMEFDQVDNNIDKNNEIE